MILPPFDFNNFFVQYNGKDDRAYRGDPIDWVDLAAAMKAENGACPYGEYNHLIKNETSTGKGACRVYQYTGPGSTSN